MVVFANRLLFFSPDNDVESARPAVDTSYVELHAVPDLLYVIVIHLDLLVVVNRFKLVARLAAIFFLPDDLVTATVSSSK